MEGPRGLKSGEMGSLIKLLDPVFRKDCESSMAADYPQLLNDENQDRLRVISDGDKIICHVGYVLRDITVFGCTMTTGCIGAVASHQEYRGKGLATRVLHDALEHMRAEGADLVMISGGRGLYLRNGAASVGRCYEMKIGCENLDDLKGSAVEIKEITKKEDVPPAAAMYEGDPVRFLRPLKDWHFFLKSKECRNAPANLFIMRVGERAAYAVVLTEPVEGCMTVAEFAGDRLVLLGGLCGLARERGVDIIHLSVMDWDESTLDLLRGRGCEEEAVNMPGTARIIDFPRLIERLKPRFEESIGAERASRISGSERNGDLVLAVGEDTFTYDFGAATQMIFSGEDVPDALKDVLPVPVPWCGLNYV